MPAAMMATAVMLVVLTMFVMLRARTVLVPVVIFF